MIEHRVETFIADSLVLGGQRTYGWQCFTCDEEEGGFRSFAEAEADGQRHGVDNGRSRVIPTEQLRDIAARRIDARLGWASPEHTADLILSDLADAGLTVVAMTQGDSLPGRLPDGHNGSLDG